MANKIMSRLLCLALVASGSGSVMADEAITTSVGKVKMKSLIQFWAHNETDYSAGNRNSSYNNFMFKRAEVKFDGDVTDSIRFFLAVDAAKRVDVVDATGVKGDNDILQDAGIGYVVGENFEILAGQFKIPTLAEGTMSSSKLLLPERSIVARTFGDRREQGFMADYNPSPYRLRAMVSNGSRPGVKSANRSDTDTSKDLNVRADYKLNENISYGAFYSNSQWSYGEAGTTNPTGVGKRFGGDIEYSKDQLVLRASAVSADENKISYSGAAVEAGYMISEKGQLAGRFESYARTEEPKFNSSAYTFGYNHFLSGDNAKLQLATTILNNMDSSNGSVKANHTTPRRDGNLTVLSFQVAL